jgi:2'-5' RNA ligase
MKTSRMFVAIALPAPVGASLDALVAPLDGVTWASRAQRHLTLRFLGDVSDEKVESITAHLAAVRVEPFVLPIEDVGAFPPKAPPRVLWIGVGRGHPRLHQLRQRVDDALLAPGLLDLDVRAFHPHVTLARCGTAAGAKPVAKWLLAHEGFAAPPFRVDAFGLYASQLEPDGARHTLVRQFALAK